VKYEDHEGRFRFCSVPPGRAEFHHGLLAATPLCNRCVRGPVLRARILLAVLLWAAASSLRGKT